MNSGDCLSEDRHDHGISSIRSWKLHVVSELVRRDALQYELAGISVLALVALEWNSQKPNSDRDSKAKNDYGQSPPCDSQDFVMAADLVDHRKAIPVKSSGVQLHDLLRAIFAKKGLAL
jgi:hypothetical protein